MKIFIIAGEASGDQLGASILHSLKSRHINQIDVRGIGGQNLLDEGLSESLFPMDDLSLMGVTEIIPHLPKLLRRIDQTATAIRLFNPDIILTIDSPDFCFRVLEKLKSTKIKSKKIHVVAPSVWAWRPKRAKKIAKFLDGLLCLLPFEPPYFEKEGLKAQFMGHPVMNSPAINANGNAFRFRHMIGLDQPTCGIFFGSRTGELDRHSEIFLSTAEKIHAQNSDIVFVVPTLPKFKNRLEENFRARGLKAIVTTDKAEKFEAIKSCTIALNVSGTIGLELAVANVPHIMAYKFSTLSYKIGKLLVKAKFGHLANIILNTAIVPEFIQEEANSENLSESLLNLLNNPSAQIKQKDAFDEMRNQLSGSAQKNSATIAAEFIESFLES